MSRTLTKRTLFERVSNNPGLQVDRENCVIRNVKILGFDSANGRKYTAEAVKNAAPLYENIRVNTDHPDKDPDQPRSVHDRIGKLVNVRFVEGKGLFGDLKYIPTKAFIEDLLWSAENEPDLFGLSHNAVGEGDDDSNGVYVVKRITEVRHVDLVADPATTKSLSEGKTMKTGRKTKKSKADDFELLEGEEGTTEQDCPEGDDLEASIAAIISGDGEAADKAKKIADLVKSMMEDGDGDEEDTEEGMDEDGGEDKDKVKGTAEEDYDGDPEDNPKNKKKATESRQVARLSAEVKALTEQLKLEKKARFICSLAESKGVKLDSKTAKICLGLPRELIEHQVQLAAKANTSGKPKSGYRFTESQEAAPKISTENLASWLQS